LVYAAGREPVLLVLNLPTQQPDASFPLSTSASVTALAFSPSAEMLLVGFESGLLVGVEVATGKTLHSWQAHHAAIHKIAFSPDQTRLATSAKDGFVKVWEIEL